MHAEDWISLAVGIIGVTVGVITFTRWFWRLGRRINHFLDDVNGEDPRPGVPARPGIMAQVNELRVRQEEIAEVADLVAGDQRLASQERTEIAAVARQAAEDITAVRLELTRNGGDSTKDEVEAAARAAEAASEAASRVEALLRRHMENGLEIMEVGIHNDAQVAEAIRKLGGEMSDIRPFPPVDIGDIEL